MLRFVKTTDIPGELTEFSVIEDGRQIGTVYREWDTMTEWGIDGMLEARFGANAASGHRNVRATMRELIELDRQQKEAAAQ